MPRVNIRGHRRVVSVVVGSDAERTCRENRKLSWGRPRLVALRSGTKMARLTAWFLESFGLNRRVANARA